MSKPLISIVIPALNEEQFLPLLLDDLVGQTLQDFEVVVVDGQSTDQTVQKASQYADRLDLRVLVADKKGVSRQRNIGGSQAKSEWLIFMDADNRIPKEFVEKITEKLGDNLECDLFECLVAPETPQVPDVGIAQILNLTILINFALRTPIAFGSLIGVKKSVFLQYQFNEEMNVLEDLEFVRSIYQAGHKLEIFAQPRYTYSLRRVKKLGLLKTVQVVSKMQMETIRHTLQGSASVGDDVYPMLGGEYYDHTEKNVFRDLNQRIKKLSSTQVNQLQQAMQVFINRFPRRGMKKGGQK